MNKDMQYRCCSCGNICESYEEDISGMEVLNMPDNGIIVLSKCCEAQMIEDK